MRASSRTTTGFPSGCAHTLPVPSGLSWCQGVRLRWTSTPVGPPGSARPQAGRPTVGTGLPAAPPSSAASADAVLGQARVFGLG